MFLIFKFFVSVYFYFEIEIHCIKQSLTIRNSNGANHLTRKIRWTTSTIIILLSTLHYTQNIYLIFQTSTFQRPTKRISRNNRHKNLQQQQTAIKFIIISITIVTHEQIVFLH